MTDDDVSRELDGARDPGPEGRDPGPWPEPLDLFAQHLAAPAALDGTCLPATLLRFATAEAARLAVDPVGIAACAIALCSGLLSDDWQVRLKRQDPWSQQARIWVGLVAAPGQKKTDQLRAAKRPVDRIEAELREEHRRELASHQEAHAAWRRLPKREREAADEPRPPAQARITTQDATVEALSELLRTNRKLIVLVDELANFLGSFERYSSGRGSSGRSHALELYEGGPRHIDRIVRGSVHVPNWSAVVVGAIQPEKLRGMVGDLSTDGLLQRFTMIVPAPVVPADPDDDDRPADREALAAYEALLRGLRGLRPPPRDGGGFLEVRAGVDCQPARRRLFRLVERIEADPALPAALRETVSKWRGLLARLALVLHCVGVAEGGTDPATLAAGTVEMAASFVRRVVAPSAFRFYRELGLDGDPHARWIAGHVLARGLGRITAYEVGHAYRELRGDVPAIVRAMGLLEHAGWVRGDGHPCRPRWEVNPRAHEAFAGRAAAEREHRRRVRERIRVGIDALAG